MTRKIDNEDFKIAAAMLARGQGYTLKNAAESLGVDPGSTCLWVRKYAPVTAAPALDASPEQLQRENQRLREENRRLLMEREILKKRRHSSRRSSREICLHQRSPGSIPRRSSVWCPPGFAKWLLRLESTTVQSWRTASDPTRGRNPASPRQEPRYLRLASCLQGSQGPRRALLREHGGEVDEGSWRPVQSAATVRGSNHRQPPRPSRSRKCAESGVLPGSSQ